jgi:hypothetical protein
MMISSTGQDRRNRHTLPVARRTRGPSRAGHGRLEVLSLKVLVHDFEHGHLAQLWGPDVGLVLLVHLHIGSVLVGHIDFRRMGWTPESGAHQLLRKSWLSEQTAELGPADLVDVRDHAPAVRTRQACIAGF